MSQRNCTLIGHCFFVGHQVHHLSVIFQTSYFVLSLLFYLIGRFSSLFTQKSDNIFRITGTASSGSASPSIFGDSTGNIFSTPKDGSTPNLFGSKSIFGSGSDSSSKFYRFKFCYCTITVNTKLCFCRELI